MVHFLLAIIYAAFISLGLPDALLGAGWPVMQPEFAVPVSWMGAVALLISLGTVVSSLMADRMTRILDTGLLTALSVGLTAVAIVGFATSTSYWHLCLWAVPYGLGAGSVDSCLNNYVAVHYSGKHMSWLHCMWGLGAASGPYIMSASIAFANNWRVGYWSVGLLQIVLTACLFFSLPIWKKNNNDSSGADVQQSAPLTLRQIFAMPGAKVLILTFFCYCAMEQTAGQWAASYFFGHIGLKEELCALFASMYYTGIMVGRFINGFLTVHFTDRTLIRAGSGLIIAGLLVMMLPFGWFFAVFGMLMIGLGSAPIYPCVIHTTPSFFGASNSQAVIGVEMASAYVGICVMPPIFGFVADWIGIWVLPMFLLVITMVMLICHERAYKAVKKDF